MKISVFKIVLIFIISLSGFSYAFSQKGGEDPYKGKSNSRKAKAAADIGDKYFRNYEYYLAAQEYKKAIIEDPSYLYALYHLAESYRLYFDYDNARIFYRNVLDIDAKAYPLAEYWYASMLKHEGQYEEALKNFHQFIEDYPDSDPNATQLKEKARIDAKGCELAINELKKPVRDFEFTDLPGPVNTGNSEYSPALFKNDTSIIITSARPGTVGDKDDGTLGGKFSDMFRFEKEADSAWVQNDSADSFADLNTHFHESAGSFTADKKKFYFTSCNDKVVKKGVPIYECVIYVTKFADGVWSKPEKLNDNINVKGEYTAEPSISPKGDTLFFVSKKPGGKGMSDIYYSTCTGDDNWGEAVNMEQINTQFIEKSPCYYSKEKILFFSSNGREGFGGLDIFKAFFAPAFDTIKNIGLPFNSNSDDFYFVLGDKKGYLASNRDGGIGNDDIYMFNPISKEALIAQVEKDSMLALAKKDSLKSISIEGTVLNDGSNEPASDVEGALKDKEGKTIKTTKTNEEGKFRFENLPVDDYKVTLEDEEPSLTGKSKYIVEDLKVKGSDRNVSKVLFENIYFNFDKYNLRPEARKVLRELADYLKEHPEVQVEMNANTDSYGTSAYNNVLSRKRGEAAFDYLVKKGIDKSSLVVNALGESKPIATNTNPAGRQLNRRVEFYILGGEGFQAKAMAYIVDPNATLEDIAKKFNMTVDELKQLNGLETDELQAYQPLRVRRTGDDDIIAPVTLSLVTPSSDEPETSDPRFALNQTSPEKYRQPELASNEDFYIVAPKNTLFSIARLFGMKVNELKELNHITSDTIHIGQRLVVKTLSSEQLTEGREYVVKEGDTMASIAKRFGISPQKLKELNALDGYLLYRHMVLRVK